MVSKRAWGPILVFVCAFAILLLTMQRELNIYDEGVVLSDALLIRHGWVPHRDFYTSYGPGSATIVALLLSLFDAQFLAARMFGIAAMAAIVAIVFLLLAGRVSRTLGAVGAAGVLLWMIASPMYLYPLFPCCLLSLIGIFILTREGAALRIAPPLGAGITAGLAAYFRYDSGFFLLLIYCMAILITVLVRDRRLWLRAVRNCLLCGIGAAVIFLPGAIGYLLVAPVSAFKADVVDYALLYYAKTRSLPFPSPLDTLRYSSLAGVYFPIVAMVAALRCVVSDLRQKAEPGTIPLTLLLGLATTILYYKGIVRPVSLHMMLAIVPAVPLLVLAADRWRRLAGRANGLVISAAFLVLEPAILAAAAPLGVIAHQPASSLAGRWLHLGANGADWVAGETCAASPRLRGAWLAASQARTARFIMKHSAPNDPILLATVRHDRVIYNPISLYFVTDRLPATHWAQYDPGVQTRADIQRFMIAEFTRVPPRLIIRDGSDAQLQEPNESAKSSGVHLLDAWIDARYRPVARTGNISIWQKRDRPLPALDEGPETCRMAPPISAPIATSAQPRT